MTVDTTIKHSGKASAAIKFVCGEKTDFGSLAQSIAADEYRSKRVRFSGWLKTEKADAAGFWMRVDGTQRLFGFDNMMNRPVKGTTDWKIYEVVLDVPAEAVNIFFGTIVSGNGQVWADDLKLEIVGHNIQSTNQLSPEQMKIEDPNRIPKKSERKQPVNLDFENGMIP
jgi:serine/threonine-protein kinase